MLGDRQEKLELRRKLLLVVEAVREVDASDAAVGVDLHAEGLDVVGAVRASGKVRQVKLDLIPPLIESHRHGADERFHTRCALVVGRAEAATHVLVVQHHHFEGEVLFELQMIRRANIKQSHSISQKQLSAYILDDHDEKRQLDAERLFGVRRALNIGRAHVGSHDLENRGLDIRIRYALDMAVADCEIDKRDAQSVIVVRDNQSMFCSPFLSQI